MSSDNLQSPSAATLRRLKDSDEYGRCLVCDAEPNWQCDEIVHRQSGRESTLGKAALPVVGWSKSCSTSNLARHLSGPRASTGAVLHNAQIVARSYLELRRKCDLLEEQNAFLRKELCDFAEKVYDAFEEHTPVDGDVTVCASPRARRGKSTAEIPVQSMAEIVATEQRCELEVTVEQV